MRFRPPARGFLLLGSLFFAASAQDCRADLSQPPNSLGASNAHGYLQLWRGIEDVDFGKGLTQPLSVRFSSERQNPSPYLGSGWWCPLLESRAYLKRDKMLRAELPCGQVIYLRQSKTDPNAYQTPNKQMAAWIDKEKGDITLAGSCCGEFRYRQGRLYQIKSPEGRLITLVYNGNLVTEIREEGNAITPFKLVTTSGGVPTGMYVNGKLHTFELGKRPRVENTNGKNVIAGFEPSLALWKFPDGKQETYQFEVGPDVAPNLKLKDRDNSESSYVWDVATGHLVSDGEWTYTVGKTAGPFDLPKLNRVNSKGEEEFRYVDTAKGITEVKNLKQGHTITETFLSSGPLYGKVRKIDKIVNGVKKTVFQAGYDEAGRLLREVDENGFRTVYGYDANGKQISKSVSLVDDPDLRRALAIEEGILLKKRDAAANELDRESALQDLWIFYISKELDFVKAAETVALLKEPERIFNARSSLITANPAINDDQKRKLLLDLIAAFPEKKQYIANLIN